MSTEQEGLYRTYVEARDNFWTVYDRLSVDAKDIYLDVCLHPDYQEADQAVIKACEEWFGRHKDRRMENAIQCALDKLENVQGEELTCAMLANLVGYCIQYLVPEVHVRVVEGEAEELLIHFWLEVGGKRVDPWVAYYGEFHPSWYKKTGEVYPVYGPERASGRYEQMLWVKYMASTATQPLATHHGRGHQTNGGLPPYPERKDRQMYDIYERKIHSAFAGTGLECLIVEDGVILAHTRGWDNPSVVDDNWQGDLVGTLAGDRGPGFRKLRGFQLEQAQAWAEDVVQFAERVQVR